MISLSQNIDYVERKHESHTQFCEYIGLLDLKKKVHSEALCRTHLISNSGNGTEERHVDLFGDEPLRKHPLLLTSSGKTNHKAAILVTAF
jgi:hypothetical protein